MNQEKMTKQILDFNKTTFDNTFNAMVLLQEQTEKVVSSLMEQAPWISAEGKKAMNDWVDSLKKGRGKFKKVVDESFVKVEACFSQMGQKQGE